jgi:preprotein translocase SecE subunit
VNNEYIKLGVWAVVVGAAFAFAWRKGYLKRMADYVQETRHELKQCSWPTREELKGSTVVVTVAFVLMSLFTMGVDLVVAFLIRQMI